MFNLLKFVFIAAVVAAATSVAIALFAVVSIATINGTTQHLWSTASVDLMGLIAGYLAPWVVGIKFLNFALWLRRRDAAIARWQKAIDNAYRYPRSAAAKELSRAMQSLDIEMSIQAGWLATNTRVVNALKEGKWRDTRAALNYIDIRSM